MLRYIVPTVPTFHIGNILKAKESEYGLKVRYPEPHEKTGKFYFPGGECYCRLTWIKEIQDQVVEVIHSGYSTYPVNDSLEFLRQTLHILNEPILGDGTRLNKPRHIFLRILSFPYSKQDFNWVDGENNRARQLIKEFLQSCDLITVLAPHFTTRDWAKKLLDEGKVQYLSPYKILCEAIKEDYPKEEFLFVSPGKFARTDFPLIRTHRVRGLNVEIEDKVDPEKYRGRNVVVVDDLTLTGKTTLQFAKRFHRLGVSKLILALPHIGTIEALKTVLNQGYNRIYTTNSCSIFSPKELKNEKLVVLDISPLLIEVMRNNEASPPQSGGVSLAVGRLLSCLIPRRRWRGSEARNEVGSSLKQLSYKIFLDLA